MHECSNCGEEKETSKREIRLANYQRVVYLVCNLCRDCYDLYSDGWLSAEQMKMMDNAKESIEINRSGYFADDSDFVDI